MISPPDDNELTSYIDKPKGLAVWAGLLSFIPLVIGMVLFLQATLMDTWFYLPFFALTVFYLSVSYLIGVFSPGFDPDKYDRICLQLKHLQPSVDVYLPVCGEDKAIIANAWSHTRRLQWPHLNIYVLDDSPTDSLRELAEAYGFHYIRRPNRGENKKAGNLKYAFTRTRGDHILILDADFCPRSDMIERMMPVMLSDNTIGIVQSPQFFEVSPWMSWVERGAGYVQELFYRVIQVSRNHYQGPICVGSCALYNRRAMELIGGPVQIEHSEDVWTGYTLTTHGYRVEYLPLALSKGRCPDSLSQYFNQQYRWCSGSLSLGLSSQFWESNLTALQKVCYSSGFLYYITTALSLFLLHAPGLFMMWFLPEKIYAINIMFYAPSFLFGTAFILAWSVYKPDWNYIYLRQVSYYAHLFALTDKLRGKIHGWVPTGQKGGPSRYHKARRVAFVLNATILTLLAFGTVNASQYNSLWQLLPPLVFSCLNSFIAVRSFAKNET